MGKIKMNFKAIFATVITSGITVILNIFSNNHFYLSFSEWRDVFFTLIILIAIIVIVIYFDKQDKEFESNNENNNIEERLYSYEELRKIFKLAETDKIEMNTIRKQFENNKRDGNDE